MLLDIATNTSTKRGLQTHEMKYINAGVMYGLLTFNTEFIMDFITDFYLIKVSYKVHNKVEYWSPLSIHDSSMNVSRIVSGLIRYLNSFV